MTFHSILFPDPADRPDDDDGLAQPDFFVDLNLDQLIEHIVAGKEAYNLKPFFHAPLSSIDAIAYRQEIMRELEDDILLETISKFAGGMTQVQRYLRLISNLDHAINQAGWFLEAAMRYVESVSELGENLDRVALQSQGLRKFRDLLARTIASEQFTSLVAETRKLRAELDTVHYCVRIKDETVWVNRCDPVPDYSTDVIRTFQRFKQQDAQDYTTKFTPQTGMNHIDAQIITCVARFYPEIFTHLREFHTRNRDFIDPALSTFDREIQFYVSYITFLKSIRAAGLPICYPEITPEKSIYGQDCYDLALADHHTRRGMPVVTNSFSLQGAERIFVVTGPNQGGKTTFARMIGQMHYLARLGCPTPGSQARLFLFDSLFTQFEKEETLATLRGKLADDLARLHEILERATPNSIIILNEVFSSTTLHDAIFLSKEIMKKLEALDSPGVFVTFMDELASLSEKTVSMVSEVDPENPTLRTYKITRRPADGMAYALSIARKHGLTYEQIKERLAR